MALSKKERESRIVQSVLAITKEHEDQISGIKNKWRDNFALFRYGSVFEDKEDWQSSFSINKYASAIRAAQGEIRPLLLSGRDYWDLECRNAENPQAVQLQIPFKKLINYYLDTGKFPRIASRFILQSLISMGSMVVGWKQRLAPNPKYVLEKAKIMREQEQRKLAPIVENTQSSVTDGLDDIQASIERAVDDLSTMLKGEPPTIADDVKPYIQIGTLDFQLPNPENVGWDSNVQFMEDSQVNWYSTTMHLWQIKQLAKQGFFNKNALKISPASKPEDKTALQNIVYAGKTTVRTKPACELLVYFGPLIIDGAVEKERYHCIIANGTTLIKESDYPFWEPPGHLGPMINAAIKEIPQSATGAGMGDNANSLQRAYDANWNLINDQMRLGVGGLNIVNWTELIDKNITEEGIEPGLTVAVRGNPNEVFKRVDLTSNLENQAHPVQEAIRQGIDEAVGLNSTVMGAAQLRSRTTKAEVQALAGSTQRTVNANALDLEQQFIVPVLEKVFARVLQFGIPELRTNPEIANVLTEDEISALTQLTEEDRIKALSQFYKFKITGFSNQAQQDEDRQRINEVFQIVSSNPVAVQMCNLPELLKEIFRKYQFSNIDRLLLPDSEMSRINTENQLLMGNTQVGINEKDNHEMHLQNQGPLAQSPYATPAVVQHVQMHMQAFQQIQLQQKMAQASQPNGLGPH